MVIGPFTMRGGFYRCMGTYVGQGNFIVWANPVDDYDDLLFNEIGSYSGESLFELEYQTQVLLEITARGSWTLTFTRIA